MAIAVLCKDVSIRSDIIFRTPSTGISFTGPKN
ncbi:unnamed protein product, partial [marine sediment metagenome]